MRKETENLVINYKNQQLLDLNNSNSIISDIPNEFLQISEEIKKKIDEFCEYDLEKGTPFSDLIINLGSADLPRISFANLKINLCCRGSI